VKLDRDKYMESVEFWSKNALVKWLLFMMIHEYLSMCMSQRLETFCQGFLQHAKVLAS
jgi:hypothetical protein